MDASERGVSIVVPTWREAANLAPLAERVSAAMSAGSSAGSSAESSAGPVPWELVFVDDDSQDGSEGIAADLARRFPVRLESRREGPRDLSLAVLEGVRLSRYDRIVVMDADLSHPPESIPALLAELERGGCDLVVGSRYAPGSRIAPGWSRWRLFGSRLATRLAQPLAPVSDPLSGFLAMDRRSLPDLGPPRPLGYKIGLEWMVRGRLRVREVPIGFAERNLGASKMTWRQQVAYLSQLLRLYFAAFRVSDRAGRPRARPPEPGR